MKEYTRRKKEKKKSIVRCTGKPIATVFHNKKSSRVVSTFPASLAQLLSSPRLFIMRKLNRI